MDYLLRDSYHAGVDYGKFDWRRLVNSVELVKDPESGEWRLGVAEGGRHVAEALIIARYMMFSQVYFHKSRVILDHHLHEAVRTLLPDGKLPPPTRDRLPEFLAWDDWRVLGAFATGDGGDHARHLRERNFYRLVHETPEFPESQDMVKLERIEAALVGLGTVRGGKHVSLGIGQDLKISWSRLGGRAEEVLGLSHHFRRS